MARLFTVVLPLLRSAAAQGFEPSCSIGATPCEHTCTDGITVDLAPFKAHTPPQGFYRYTDQEHQQDYYFDACGPIKAVSCTGSSTHTPAAIQTYGQPAPQPPTFPASSCAAIGSFTTQSCAAAGSGNFTCTYTSGDGDRSVAFEYSCASTYQAPTASQPDPEAVPAHYVIHFAGPAACKGAEEAGGWSWGDTVCLLFPLLSALYLGGGYFYNYKYKELRGVEAVPQLEYWQQVRP